MTRRALLAAALGTSGVALAGVLRAHHVGLGNAVAAPWEALEQETGLRAIAAAGVLAASPHNSQPWKFRLRPGAIDVRLDLGRALGPVDPVLRQLHLGLGCAIENLVVGASVQGLTTAVTLFPDPLDNSLAARLRLSGGWAPRSPHAAAIARRHTNRGPYSGAAVDVRRLGALRAQVRCSDTALRLFDASSASGQDFAQAILTSTQALIEDEVFMRATDAWFRWTPREVREHLDGPSLDCAGLPLPLRLAAQLGPRSSAERFHKDWYDSTRDVHLGTAPTFGAISVRDASDPRQLVEAGRLWQRVHLQATLEGLALQPLDQWLECVDRNRQRGLPGPFTPPVGFAPPGATPVMMFRAGAPLRSAQPSARRPLDAVLMS